MSNDVVRVNCIKDACGTFVMDRELRDRYKRTGETFHCPAGHGMHFTETTESQLREQIADLEEKVEHWKRRYNSERDRGSGLWKERNQLRGAIKDIIRYAGDRIVEDRGSGVVGFSDSADVWVCECGGRGRAIKQSREAAEDLYEQHQEESCGLSKSAIEP